MKKQKQTRERSTQGRGANSFITEMAVFTPETDHSCETGYPFDNSRQIGNASSFENGMVLILNEQSAWLYPPILTDSLKRNYPFQIACVQPPPPLPSEKNRKGVHVYGGGGDCTQASLRRMIHFLAPVWKRPTTKFPCPVFLMIQKGLYRTTVCLDMSVL